VICLSCFQLQFQNYPSPNFNYKKTTEKKVALNGVQRREARVCACIPATRPAQARLSKGALQQTRTNRLMLGCPVAHVWPFAVLSKQSFSINLGGSCVFHALGRVVCTGHDGGNSILRGFCKHTEPVG
jgi:hypothetical protein